MQEDSLFKQYSKTRAYKRSKKERAKGMQMIFVDKLFSDYARSIQSQMLRERAEMTSNLRSFKKLKD